LLTVKASQLSASDIAYLKDHGLKQAGGASPLAGATKERPFVNSLGMKFVPVPDTDVLFCTTLTRSRDYNRFATETGVKEVEKLGAGEKRDQNLFPASTLSWNNVKAFCDWLSKKEGLSYRLPTDREWSVAVGIGGKEPKDAMPADLNGKLADTYPWGTQWPPPDGVGNFCDESFKAFCKRNKFQLTISIINGYRDGEYAIAPVEAMKPNRLGLHDMGGNLRQWCEDWYDATQTKKHLRGSSWDDADPDKLLSCKRWPTDPAYEENNRNANGFRCVLEIPKQ
jgi:formylglycine-generating enzyme required for sulfatase activity